MAEADLLWLAWPPVTCSLSTHFMRPVHPFHASCAALRVVCDPSSHVCVVRSTMCCARSAGLPGLQWPRVVWTCAWLLVGMFVAAAGGALHTRRSGWHQCLLEASPCHCLLAYWQSHMTRPGVLGHQQSSSKSRVRLTQLTVHSCCRAGAAPLTNSNCTPTAEWVGVVGSSE